MREEELLLHIESCRNKMIELARENSLFSQEVVTISSELDELLNKYEKVRLTRKK